MLLTVFIYLFIYVFVYFCASFNLSNILVTHFELKNYLLFLDTILFHIDIISASHFKIKRKKEEKENIINVHFIFTAILLCLVLVNTLHCETTLSNVMTLQVQP